LKKLEHLWETELKDSMDGVTGATAGFEGANAW